MNRNDIPWLVLLIGFGFLSLMGWSLYRATQESSSVTDRDYYSHGLRYNETLLEQKAAESLGWSITTNLRARTLTMTLHDSDGQPVSAARGQLALYRPKQAATIDLPVQDLGRGRYRTVLPDDLSGAVNVHLVFERDGARITRQLLLNF